MRQACLPARLILTPQIACALSVGSGEIEQVLLREVASRLDPAENRGDIERCTPKGLPHEPCGGEPVSRYRSAKERVGILPHQPGSTSGRTAAHGLRFQQDDLDSG